MDLVSIFATVILVTTVGTLVMAVAAYFAYKVREWRKPKSSAREVVADEAGAGGPIFLKRYQPSNSKQDDHAVNG